MSRPPVIYSIPRLYGIGPCLYRLAFNDKYVLVKAKECQKSIEAIQKALNQFMRHSELQRNPENLYYHFFSFISRHQKGTFEVKVLLESDNAYELLKAEQLALNEARKDKNCLNNATEAYIPAYNEATETYGWISKSAVLNFRKWLKQGAKSQ